MLELYNDREHTFTCDVKIEGSSYTKATPRLVISSPTKNLFFEGKIAGGKCHVTVPPMSDIEVEGNVSLELVVDNALLKPWTSKYKVVSTVKSEAVDPKMYTRKLVKETTKTKPVRRKTSVPKANITTKKKVSIFKESATKSNRTLVSDLLTIFNTMPNDDQDLVKEVLSDYNPSKKTMTWANAVFSDTDSFEAKICMYESEQIMQSEEPKKTTPARDKALPSTPTKPAEKPETKKEPKQEVKKPVQKAAPKVVEAVEKAEHLPSYKDLVESHELPIVELDLPLVLRDEKDTPKHKKKKSDLYRKMMMI